MTNQDTSAAKIVVLDLVRQFCPDSVDSVEEGFESLAQANFKVPSSVPQHAFHIPPETWSYAQSIAVFVGGIFAGAIKDVAKDQIKKLMSELLNRKVPLTKTDADSLVKAIEKQGKALGIPQAHRKQLETDFRQLLVQRRSEAAS